VEPSETSLTHSGWDVFQKFPEIESLASRALCAALQLPFAQNDIIDAGEVDLRKSKPVCQSEGAD
jgi:hypothetical protein